jgi:hypothetical protein
MGERVDLFKVRQSFKNDFYEDVLDEGDAQTAVYRFIQCCTSVGAKLGTTRRVIIVCKTDDTTSMEWLYEEGITFPESKKGMFKWKKD